MREWLVIEKTSSRPSDDAKRSAGYIPRDAAERLLGRELGDGVIWFTEEESERMRQHPEWSDTGPIWSPLGFWL